MFTFITILIVLAAIALVFIVLVQKSKGGGLASGFSSSNQIMGVRKTTDFLEKATWWLAGTIIVLSLVSTLFLDSATKEEADVVSKVKIPTTEVQAPALPNLGGEASVSEAPQTETPAETQAQK